MLHPRPRLSAPRSLSASARSPLGLLVAVSIGSTGCKSEFAGEWKAECSVGVGSSSVEMPVRFELADAGKGTLSGVGSFEYNDYTFEGGATGRELDDDGLAVDIEGVYGGYVITVELEATWDGEELEGVCAFEDQETLYEGDVLITAVGE